MYIPDTGLGIFVLLRAPSEWLLTTLQRCKAYVVLLPSKNFFSMEVWNGIWKKILIWNRIWNGRFLVWNGNGMEENCQYGIWQNHLPFHTMPCCNLCYCTMYSLVGDQHTSHTIGIARVFDGGGGRTTNPDQ